MNIRTHELAGPAGAWKGADMAHRIDWLHRLSSEHIAEIEAATAAWAASCRPLSMMEQADFALPTLSGTLKSIAESIEHKHGFALIRGLPVEQWGVEQTHAAYWGISLHIGLPVSQNRNGERLCAVRDAGADATAPDARGPQTNAELYFHSDFADVVGLLCIRSAKSGGTSRICSAFAIHDALLEARRSDLLDALYEGYFMDRKGEQLPGMSPVTEAPIPMLCRQEGRLYFRYVPGWVAAARERTGKPWTVIQREAFDAVNRLAGSPGYALDMNFQPGDIQYLNNYRVLHSRTAFVDHEEADRKRLLQRIWLYAHRASDLPDDFDHLFGPTSTRRGIPAHPTKTR